MKHGSNQRLRMSAVDHDEFADQLRISMRKYPSNRSAPVVRDQHGTMQAELLDQALHVINKSVNIVSGARPSRFAVASQIGSIDASFTESLHHRSPAHPSFRKSVQAQHRRPILVSSDRHMKIDAVGRYAYVFDTRFHQCSIGISRAIPESDSYAGLGTGIGINQSQDC